MKSPEDQINAAKTLLRELDVRWYKRRLKQLNEFAANANSKTLAELINMSIELTRLSQHEWSQLKHVARSELRDSIEGYRKRTQELNEGIAKSHKKMLQIAAEGPTNKEGSGDIQELGDVVLQLLQESHDQRYILSESALRLTVAFSALSESLLEKTLRPDYSGFHKKSAKEIVLDLFKKYSGLDVLDDIGALRKLYPNYRLNTLLASGDEIAAYIEQYNDQLVEWILVCRKARKTPPDKWT